MKIELGISALIKFEKIKTEKPAQVEPEKDNWLEDVKPATISRNKPGQMGGTKLETKPSLNDTIESAGNINPLKFDSPKHSNVAVKTTGLDLNGGFIRDMETTKPVSRRVTVNFQIGITITICEN